MMLNLGVCFMQGLSKKEIEIISWLEFHKRYFFTVVEIEQFAKNKTQRYNIIKNLVKKKRIIKLNRQKYYLVPIKAKSGSWAEHPFILIDEICDGKEYIIGGWGAANYWHLTEQIPMGYDVYTTRRQGKVGVLNTRILFHRSSRKRIEKAVIKDIQGHPFRVEPKQDSLKWIHLLE